MRKVCSSFAGKEQVAPYRLTLMLSKDALDMSVKVESCKVWAGGRGRGMRHFWLEGLNNFIWPG